MAKSKTSKEDKMMQQVHPVVNTDLWMVLKMLKEPDMIRCYQSQGIPQSEWELTFGPNMWKVNDRDKVRRCCDSLMLSSLRHAGLADREIPAEVVAAYGVSFINPVNWLIYCAWYENANTADQMVARADSEPDIFVQGLSSRQLVGLMQRYAGPDFSYWTAEVKAALVAQKASVGEVEVPI